MDLSESDSVEEVSLWVLWLRFGSVVSAKKEKIEDVLVLQKQNQ